MELNNCKVYKATKLETFLSRFLPYHLPFINKRKRVRIRNHFRYAYQRRLMKDMTNTLKEIYVKDSFDPIHWLNELGKWNEEDYSWEVIN